MSGRLRRALADLACRALQATLPPSLQSWGWAVRCETAEIPNDTKALLFALGSLCGLMPRAVASLLLYPFASFIGDGALSSGGSLTMNVFDAAMRRPRVVGIACAIGSVALGLAYMAIAGAPARYLVINVGALVVGLTLLALLGRTTQTGQHPAYWTLTAMAGTLLDPGKSENAVDLAPWVQISAKAPPTLIIHAMNDPVDDIRHPMAYALALNNAGVPVDMRLYAKGGHAFGMRRTADPITTEWPAQVKQWLQTIGML